MALATSHLGPLVEIAQAAERSGLARVWTTEGFGGDGVVRAGHLLARTQRIGVGTGIAYAFSRAPFAVATAAADLAELSGGRFALGLGAGTRGVRIRRYDVDFDHPAPRLGEYAQLVRAALDTERGLSFNGRFYHCDFPQFEPTQSLQLRRQLPIYAAALNPTMLRTAVRTCDGVALHSLALSDHYLSAQVVPALGRRERTVRLAAWKMAAVDGDQVHAQQLVRRQLAFYFSTPSYHSILAGTGWEEAADRVRVEAARVGYRDWQRVGRLLPDEMLDAFGLLGNPEDFAGAIVRTATRLASIGVDELVLQLISGRTAQETLEHGLRLARAAQPAVAALSSLEVAGAHV